MCPDFALLTFSRCMGNDTHSRYTKARVNGWFSFKTTREHAVMEAGRCVQAHILRDEDTANFVIRRAL